MCAFVPGGEVGCVIVIHGELGSSAAMMKTLNLTVGPHARLDSNITRGHSLPSLDLHEEQMRKKSIAEASSMDSRRLGKLITTVPLATSRGT